MGSRYTLNALLCFMLHASHETLCTPPSETITLFGRKKEQRNPSRNQCKKVRQASKLLCKTVIVTSPRTRQCEDCVVLFQLSMKQKSSMRMETDTIGFIEVSLSSPSHRGHTGLMTFVCNRSVFESRVEWNANCHAT
jgi:hypothetical protein